MGTFKSADLKAYNPKFAPRDDARPAPKASKYRNVRTVVDGIPFASKAEARRFSELKLAKLAGEVFWFARQVSFDLPGGQKYRADFVVCWVDGSVTIEDSKGMVTPVYAIKRALMKEAWGIEIREIGGAS